MKIFCMIAGFLMLFVTFENSKGWNVLLPIIFYLIAAFLIAFPLYLEYGVR